MTPDILQAQQFLQETHDSDALRDEEFAQRRENRARAFGLNKPASENPEGTTNPLRRIPIFGEVAAHANTFQRPPATEA